MKSTAEYIALLRNYMQKNAEKCRKVWKFPYGYLSWVCSKYQGKSRIVTQKQSLIRLFQV